MSTVTDLPGYLAGPMAPVPDEIDARDLAVIGSIPAELNGRYLRNGPNPQPGEDPRHWFTGDGMLHGIALREGRALWYRNRWVRTNALDGRPRLSAGKPDLTVTPANTHIVEHHGTLLALCEAGLPYRVDADLATVGPYDFDGRLHTAMTAHPKTDPVTGELFFFGYSALPPYLTFHVAAADGTLLRSLPIPVPGPTMMHDFAITERYVIWLDLPVVFDRAVLTSGGMPYRWNDSYGARIGVMDRRGGPVRWLEIDPCYVFHVGNAVESADGTILLDAVRYSPDAFARAWGAIGPSSHPGRGHELIDRAVCSGVSLLHRWVLDPQSGRVSESVLHERELEFPSLDDRRVGRSNRYLYAVGNSADGSRVIKFDTTSGATTDHELARAARIGEAVFVPAAAQADGEEDAGWLLSVTTPYDGSPSELLILDATRLQDPPVARIQLPRRVPAGFHGSWIPDPS